MLDIEKGNLILPLKIDDISETKQVAKEILMGWEGLEMSEGAEVPFNKTYRNKWADRTNTTKWEFEGH